MAKTKPMRGRKQSRRGPAARLLPRRALRVPRSGLHEQAATKLRELIVRGDLLPGEPLLEIGMSEALGISRTPLREALKQLATEGLVELRLNRSAVVAPLRREELTELFEAVGGIERCAAELAAIRMTSQDVARLEALQRRIEWHHGRGELRDYFEVNQQIHGAIVGFAQNAVLKAAHEALLPRVERARLFALSARGRWNESVNEHRQILIALEAGDGARAGQLLGRHVRRTGEIVADTLTNGKAAS
ncbi:MAG TPA: GntR family transcriptional regulator [Bradyrhizobium sp.]|nr:GntR family transcriptional regulator [Bradyrhizobium sp.]